jgi:hypothetical protein
VRYLYYFAFVVAACGPATRDPGGGGVDGNGGGSGGSGSDTYPIYAHSDKVLYSIDLSNKALVTIGPFNTPMADVITDLAVAPDGTIYIISETALYTASASDGHATKLGSLSACGTHAVALTTTSDGRLWMGDYMGAICQIDISVMPAVVKPPVMMSGGMALSGDFVGVADGSVFGTAYKLSDMTTQNNNELVKIDVTTGQVTMIGSSGFPKLFGTSFQNDMVFGFTHDGTGRVVTIDKASGVGTLYATFMDPATQKPISWAGAGVSSLVVIQ